MNLITSSRAAALALLLHLPAAHADILDDNLSQPIRDTSTLPSELWAAQSFVTGARPRVPAQHRDPYRACRR
jgi:hypothetical protein